MSCCACCRSVAGSGRGARGPGGRGQDVSAGGDTHQVRVVGDPAQLGDVALQRRHGSGRRRPGPDQVHQLIGGNDLAAEQGQRGQAAPRRAPRTGTQRPSTATASGPRSAIFINPPAPIPCTTGDGRASQPCRRRVRRVHQVRWMESTRRTADTTAPTTDPPTRHPPTRDHGPAATERRPATWRTALGPAGRRACPCNDVAGPFQRRRTGLPRRTARTARVHQAWTRSDMEAQRRPARRRRGARLPVAVLIATSALLVASATPGFAAPGVRAPSALAPANGRARPPCTVGQQATQMGVTAQPRAAASAAGGVLRFRRGTNAVMTRHPKVYLVFWARSGARRARTTPVTCPSPATRSVPRRCCSRCSVGSGPVGRCGRG